MHIEPQKYMVYGCISRLGPTTLEITELPIRTWTQSYKESVLEPMLTGNEKSPPFIRCVCVCVCVCVLYVFYVCMYVCMYN